MSIKTQTITIDELLERVKVYNNNEKDLKLIRKAYDYAAKKHFGQKRISGDDYIQHPLNVALILTELTLMLMLYLRHYYMIQLKILILLKKI